MHAVAETSRQTTRLEQEYLALRARRAPAAGRAIPFVRENNEPGAAFQWDERFLQTLWNEQRFSGALETEDGRSLEVVHPGTWNLEGGPDFRDASIRLDGEPVQGDIEVHRTFNDWRAHGHHRNPAYARVVLHVIWADPGGKARQAVPPCFLLPRWLDRPWQELIEELDRASYPYARQVPPGKCALRFAGYADDSLRRLFRAAGLARFSDKTRRLLRAGIRDGFDRAVYESFFDALGYKRNRNSFRALAAAVPLEILRELPDGESREALLFGTAGLLPDPTSVPVDPRRRRRLQAAWDSWWACGREQLPLTWQRGGSRPANTPERRLAAGIMVLERWRFAPTEHFTHVLGAAESPQALLRSLREELNVRSPWEPYLDYRRRLRRPERLLGKSRIDDILANVLLPFLAALAEHAGRGGRRELARRAWLRLPRLQNNRVLAEAAHRLLSPPSRVRDVARTAAEQQGMIQVYRDFCLTLHHDCENCPLRTGVPFEQLRECGTV